MYVCVCVCVCVRERESAENGRTNGASPPKELLGTSMTGQTGAPIYMQKRPIHICMYIYIRRYIYTYIHIYKWGESSERVAWYINYWADEYFDCGILV